MRLGIAGAALAALAIFVGCGGETDSAPPQEGAPEPAAEAKAQSPGSSPLVPGGHAPEDGKDHAPKGGNETTQSPTQPRSAAKQRAADRNLTAEDLENLLEGSAAPKDGSSGGSRLPPAIEEILQEAGADGSTDRKAGQDGQDAIDRILEELGQR